MRLTKKVIFASILVYLFHFCGCGTDKNNFTLGDRSTVINGNNIEFVKILNNNINYIEHNHLDEKCIFKNISVGFDGAILSDEIINLKKHIKSIDLDNDYIYVLSNDCVNIISKESNTIDEFMISENTYTNIYVKNGRIFLTRKDGADIYAEGKKIKSLKIPEIRDIEKYEDFLLIVTNKLNKSKIIILDNDDNILLEKEYNEFIIDIGVYKNSAYFITNSKVFSIYLDDSSLSEKEVLNLYSIYERSGDTSNKITVRKILVTDKNAYIVYTKENELFVDKLTFIKELKKDKKLTVYLYNKSGLDDIVIGSLSGKYPEYFIDVKYFDNIDLYCSKINTSILSGECPDIFILPNNIVSEYIQKKYLLNLNPYFNKEDYFVNLFDMASYKGEIYAYPINISLAGLVINYNLLAEKVNINPYMDINEFFNICKTISDEKLLKENIQIVPNIPESTFLQFCLTGSNEKFVDLINKKIKFEKKEIAYLMDQISQIFDIPGVVKKDSLYNPSSLEKLNTLFSPYLISKINDLEYILENGMEFIAFPVLPEHKNIVNAFGYKLYAVHTETKNLEVSVDYLKSLDGLRYTTNLINKENVNAYLQEMQVSNKNKEKILEILNNTGNSSDFLNIQYLYDTLKEETTKYLSANNADRDKIIEDLFSRFEFYLNE